jgi:hypothetical protein
MPYKGVIQNLGEQEYHSHPALSSTQARQLLDSPARFQYGKSNPQPHKDAFDLGTAVHTKVLGTGVEVITYPPEHLTPSGNASTKTATVEWVAEQRANGFVVISDAQFEQVNAMAEAVLAHPTARALFEQEGNAEASVFAADPATGVEMRARFDFLPNFMQANPCAVDLKTTGKRATKLGFERSVLDWQYETQERWYFQTLKNATGIELPFRFVVVETSAPHLVAVHELDVVWQQMGDAKTRRALDTYAQCSETNTWPGYPTEVQMSSPPVYAIYQHEEEYA